MLIHILSDKMSKVEYNESGIYINSKKIATYGQAFIRNTTDNGYIGKMYLKGDTIYAETLFGITNTFYIINDKGYIINRNTKKVVAQFNNNNPYGAMAAYIAYVYFRFLKQNNNTSTKISKLLDEVLEGKTVKRENKVIEKPVDEKSIIFNNYKKSEYKRPERKIEEYKIPEKKNEDYKLPEKKQKKVNVPVASGGGGISIIFILIIGLAIYATLQCIPDSWKDLKTYIPRGDPGIIICFFTALAGGIVSLLYSIFSKKPDFEECLTYFGGVCSLGIIISAILTLISYSKGDTKFVGFFLFDIFLCILAPVIGVLQFAIPIGIGVVVICGIICLIKKNS